ncbi:MAG: tyrosine-protein phosphatase [Clostridia bacterium]|nr:tyrosine-protein phosphatase [Clostridia bacterium]
MEIKRIKLKTLKNTRDLGGFVGADNRKIKPKRLIRSGQLGKASDEDIKILTDTYNLKTIVDLRMDAEVKEVPDKKPAGVEYIRFPLLDNSFLGIARDEYSLQSWLKVFENSSASPEELFGEMYVKILMSDKVVSMVGEFFDLLINQTEGSVLWHCSAGKDRVGVVTALVLSALGVDRETIIEDYLMTDYFSRSANLKAHIFLPLKIKNAKVRKCIYVLLGVKREYMENIFSIIDRDYGSTEKFLSERFGIDEAKINELRKNYLE